MTDLDRAHRLIDEAGNPHRATGRFNATMAAAGLEYRIATSTMQRLYAGNAKPALAALVVTVLNHSP